MMASVNRTTCWLPPAAPRIATAVQDLAHFLARATGKNGFWAAWQCA